MDRDIIHLKAGTRHTELSDTDPAASGKKPVRTWVMKTNASGEMHFTKDYFVSGDEFYYASDKKTVCLPIGTVTIQETKAPKNYFLNETVFVQKITGSIPFSTCEEWCDVSHDKSKPIQDSPGNDDSFEPCAGFIYGFSAF